MIEFRCRCGRMVRADDADAGREARCPACLGVRIVPGAPSGVTVEPNPPMPTPAEAPKKKGPLLRWPFAWLLVLSVVAFCCVGVMNPPMSAKQRKAIARMHDLGNLKQLGSALRDFHARYGALPLAVARRGKDGKPLLSWRVMILPHLEEEELFRQFDLEQPWDGPTNLPLLKKMPTCYLNRVTVTASEIEGGLTHYVAVTGPGMPFDEGHKRAMTDPMSRLRLGLRLADFTDGAEKTILVVTAADHPGRHRRRPGGVDEARGLRGHPRRPHRLTPRRLARRCRRPVRRRLRETPRPA
jgi:hypothetical protein